MRVSVDPAQPAAAFGGLLATGLSEVTSDPSALDHEGRWAVVITFEGELRCARFEKWVPGQVHEAASAWQGPEPSMYESSMTQVEYEAAVREVKARIAAGDVYQANICRVLSARLPDPNATDPAALAALLARGNAAPFQGFVRLPDHGIALATASPELFLRRDRGVITSGPIKGTATRAEDLQAKDRAENIMIVDLVRNDLAMVSVPGTVEVPDLLAVEDHPGVVHLVSRVQAGLRPGVGWGEILAAAFPPGSVSGAPKYTALQLINRLEPVERGPYCGAVGWIDADAGTAELAVGIRTFWIGDGVLHFGTGAGITWGSDPRAEWDETVLKADRLLSVASGRWR